MPIIIQLRFPGRRYHATPWGHHVNEGLVEWPPSPWRILRALISTGFTKLGWIPPLPPDVAGALIESLAARPPVYALPRAASAHSRHYVTADTKKPLIIDSWLHIDQLDAVEIHWDVSLPSDQRDQLATLLDSMGYLGRAESWVNAALVDGPTFPVNCFPIDPKGSPRRDHESVGIMCAQDAATYAAWRSRVAAEIEAIHPGAAGRKPSAAILKARQRALAPYPPNLLAALSVETGWLQSHGWSTPPGSRTVQYWRRTETVDVAPPTRHQMAGSPSVPMALLALSTPSRGMSALPPLTRTFPQGRLLHRALAASVERACAPAAALTLLGRDGPQVARGGHRHAHLLHLDLDGDARLDHVLIWVPDGLDGEAQRALRHLRRTWMKGGVGELQVALAALGDREAFRRAGLQLGKRLGQVLGPPDGSPVWRSLTPFVAPLFIKKHGRHSLQGQIAEALARRSLPAARVEVLPYTDVERLSFRHYVVHDPWMAPPSQPRLALRLSFERPIEGPLCLGYGSHFGLGIFEPE